MWELLGVFDLILASVLMHTSQKIKPVFIALITVNIGFIIGIFFVDAEFLTKMFGEYFSKIILKVLL